MAGLTGLLAACLSLSTWAEAGVTTMRTVGGQGQATGHSAFVTGYTVVWVVLMAYLAYLAGRNRKAARQIERLEQIIERRKDLSPPLQRP